VSNEPSGLEAVSCTKSECVAVGFYNDKAKGLAIMATTETGHTWHRAVQLGLPAHAAQAAHQLAELFGVACGDHDDCTAVGSYTTTSQIPEAVAARN
jgi:hypothetical protein